MGIYEELQRRELIAQVTDAEEIRELINNGGDNKRTISRWYKRFAKARKFTTNF